MKRFNNRYYGDLNVDLINKILQLELLPGQVVFTARAQKHAYSRHKKEFPHCIKYVQQIINHPLYLGDDFRNHGKIELIANIKEVQSNILLAISVEPDEKGIYYVASIYPVSQQKIQNRLRKGYLKHAKK